MKSLAQPAGTHSQVPPPPASQCADASSGVVGTPPLPTKDGIAFRQKWL